MARRRSVEEQQRFVAWSAYATKGIRIIYNLYVLVHAHECRLLSQDALVTKFG